MADGARKGSRFGAREAGRACVLAGIVAAVWCLSYGRTSLGAWRVPVDYYGDSLGHTLAYLKASMDGAVRPFGVLTVPFLNAPFEANWNDFPRQHHVQFWAAGWLARRLGLFPTANLLLLLAHVLAASSFYGVARYFRARWEWAFVGGIAFGLSPFLFYRSLAHLNLSYDWPIPLGVLVVTWCFGRRGLQAGSRRFAVALAVAAVTGFHHVYYIGLLGQFLVLASVMQAARRGRFAAIVSPLLVAALLIATAALDNAGTFAYVWQNGRNAGGLVRPYGGLERFALKPIELVLPTSDTGLVPWRALSTAYYHLALYRGELGSAYLGLAGIGALAWLVLASLTARRGRPVPAQGTRRALAWLLIYAVVGGVNGLLGTLGFVWFRATNRYSIWMLALLLLWAAVRLSRAEWTRHRPASLIAAALTCAAVLLDQVPWHDPHETIRRWASADEFGPAAGAVPGGRPASRRDALPAPRGRLPRGPADRQGPAARALPAVPVHRRPEVQLRHGQGPAARSLAAAGRGAAPGGHGPGAGADRVRRPARQPQGVRGRRR